MRLGLLHADRSQTAQGIKRASAQQRKASEVAHGRNIAPRAEAIWGWSTAAGQLRVERRTRLLAQMSEVTAGDRVLELGCGNGVFSRRLARWGIVLTAIDLSLELLQLAREKLLGVADAAVVHADVEHLPFSDQSFDAVIGSSILHHVPFPASLLEIRRVLRHGGRVAFAEPNMMNPQVMIQKNIPWIKRWAGDSPHETAFFRWRVAKALRQADFIRIVVEPYDFLHSLTPTTLAPWVQRVGLAIERLPVLRELAGSLIIAATRP